MNSVSTLPAGRNDIRKMICRVISPSGFANPAALAQLAEKRWGVASRVAADLREKAAVAAIGVSAVDGASAWNSPELFPRMRANAIVGKMPPLRVVPFNRRLIKATTSPHAYWVGEGKPKPLSSFALAGSSLTPMTLATTTVHTDEAFKSADPAIEALLDAEIVAANTERMDASFIDAGNAGVADVEPASVTHASSGAVQISSTGSPQDDLVAAVDSFGGNFDSAFWITDPTTATRLALARDAGGSFEFPDCGPKGGSILKIPLLTSRGSPADTGGGQLALIDASAIAVATEGMNVDRGEHATIEMSDAPADPTAATVLISLFQNDLVGLRSVLYANWQVQRDGAVVVVTGCTYPSA
jgi:HK97 family phage major capsid protein